MGGVGAGKDPLGVSQDTTVINPIMLRFRPIAPKPATGSAGSAADGIREGATGSVRRKRRYVRVCGSRKAKKPSRDSRVGRSDQEKAETVRFGPEEARPLDPGAGRIGRPAMGAAESWVTVLRVTDACMDRGGLGSTDEDMWRNLAGDTCPGFICDEGSHVAWANAAYRRMVAGDGAGEAEVAVRLGLGESVAMLPPVSPAFACMVRVQSTWRPERATVVPCDVWRMSDGGFAWRLDVTAGLSLGWSCIH